MSDRLIKLLDYSILPFALTILGKTLGLYIVAGSLNINWGVAEFTNSFISATPLVYARDVQILSTYSNLIMFLLIFTAFSIRVVFILLSNKAYRDPDFMRRMIKHNTFSYIQRSSLIYTKAFVWAVYLWLVTIFIVIDSILGNTQVWLVGLSMILTLLNTSIFVYESNKEFEKFLNTKENSELNFS
jgi:hypothetical protein